MTDIRTVDVFIVGAGPAGLFASLLLRRYGIKSQEIIDMRGTRVITGHASGIHPRTLEILHTMAVEHEFEVKAGGLAETSFWSPKDEGRGIERSTVANEITSASPFRRTMAQDQGRTEEVLLGEMAKRGITVRRPVEYVHHEYTADKVHPVLVSVKNRTTGALEQYRCKYLLAADGARSRVRSKAGMKTSVHDTDDTWLVVDAVVDTDFPDRRRKSHVTTKDGSIMIIPYTQNTTRTYCLLAREDLEILKHSVYEGTQSSGDYKDANHVTLLEILRKHTETIMSPYKYEVQQIKWISRYTIRQQVIDSFIDKKQHVLFIGDSSHSHSPKAGQGMNTGMTDSYNLTWKLAAILRGRAKPSLLQTFDIERLHIAKQLIDFDTKFSGLFSDTSKVGSAEFHDTWRNAQGFITGLEHEYPPNDALDKSNHDETNAILDHEAVQPLTPGKRLLPMNLIRHIDGWEVNSLSTMPANGEFYEVVFAGDISKGKRAEEFKKLYEMLVSDRSALTKYNGLPPPQGWEYQDLYTSCEKGSEEPATSLAADKKLMNLYVVHTAPHLEVDLQPSFWQWKYNFFEDVEGREHKQHGVDPQGPIVVAVVRPDGVVATVHQADEGLAPHVHGYFEKCGFIVANA